MKEIYKINDKYYQQVDDTPGFYKCTCTICALKEECIFLDFDEGLMCKSKHFEEIELDSIKEGKRKIIEIK